MSDEVVENWQHEIRKLAPLIEKAMYHVHEKEADVKQLQAKLKLRAVAVSYTHLTLPTIYSV